MFSASESHMILRSVGDCMCSTKAMATAREHPALSVVNLSETLSMIHCVEFGWKQLIAVKDFTKNFKKDLKKLKAEDPTSPLKLFEAKY